MRSIYVHRWTNFITYTLQTYKLLLWNIMLPPRLDIWIISLMCVWMAGQPIVGHVCNTVMLHQQITVTYQISNYAIQHTRDTTWTGIRYNLLRIQKSLTKGNLKLLFQNPHTCKQQPITISSVCTVVAYGLLIMRAWCNKMTVSATPTMLTCKCWPNFLSLISHNSVTVHCNVTKICSSMAD